MSKTIDDSGPAFPTPPVANYATYPRGLSRRDYFAAKALVGLLPTWGDQALPGKPKTDEQIEAARFAVALELARSAYRIADAMIAAGKE